MSTATNPTQPSATADAIHARMAGELQPLLNALSQLTKMHSILQELCCYADLDAPFAEALAKASPGYRDPFALGGEASASAIVHSLARLAATTGAEIAADAEGLAEFRPTEGTAR